VRRFALLPALALAACGGSGAAPSSVSPTASPDATVTSFLRAVKDSNLTAMSQLWGTEDGSAAETKKPDQWERRVELMQIYLKHDAARVVASGPATGAGEDRYAVTVELARAGCIRQVPFTVVRRNRGGWLVNEIELTAAGNPVKGCDPANPSPEN
jgi:hypothetical protein